MGRRTVNVEPLPFALAVGFDRPAMRFDDVLDDGQPEPEPAECSSRAAVGLAEAVEDVRQQLGTDALSVVADLNLNIWTARGSA